MIDDYLIGILANMGLLAFLALSAYLLLVGGEMSFGQQAFFGIGAYAAGTATVIGLLPFALALLLGALLGAMAATLIGLITLRLRGLYFSMATLAAAEAIRILFELFDFRRIAEWDAAGPAGSEGFGEIRRLFEIGLGHGEMVLLIYGILLLVLTGLHFGERGRFGILLRMVGEDAQLAEVFGIDVRRIKLVTAAAAGAIAALGGGLFAHYNTYIEPRNFDMMLGVHSLSYALIGGLGTPLGPLLGVAADIVLLESSRVFSGYRMIAFGGLVALLLILRPRGLLDERMVHRLRGYTRRPLQSMNSQRKAS